MFENWDLMLLATRLQRQQRVQTNAGRTIPRIEQQPSSNYLCKSDKDPLLPLSVTEPKLHLCSKTLSWVPPSDVCSCRSSRGLPLSRHSSRPALHQVMANIADCVSLLAAALAVAIMLNFHHLRGLSKSAGEEMQLSTSLNTPWERRKRHTEEDPITHSRLPESCINNEGNYPWLTSLPLLGRLPQTFRCPSLPVYLVALAIYSAAGIFHLARPPRFWADCGLVAVAASVLAGAWFSSRAVVVDGFVVGGLLSLVCCYVIEWFTRGCRGGEFPSLSRSGGGEAGGVDAESVGNADCSCKAG